MRSPIRFTRKYYAAQLLSARMFQNEAGVEDVLAEIKSTTLYKQNDTKLKEIMQLETHRLQQWVRLSCASDGGGTDRYKLFMSTVVKPTLGINVGNIPSNLQDTVARFTAILQGSEASEEDVIRLKVACSAIKGDLSRHPLICGLTLQCSRMTEKASRGIWAMSGRRSNCSEREAALVADAGQQLAMACGNHMLAKEFGISSKLCKVHVEDLNAQSLPTPSLAVRHPEVLKENYVICDQRFPKPDSAPQRSLAHSQEVI